MGYRYLHFYNNIKCCSVLELLYIESEDYYWKQECIIGFLQNAVPWLALYKQVNGCSANFKQLKVSP